MLTRLKIICQLFLQFVKTPSSDRYDFLIAAFPKKIFIAGLYKTTIYDVLETESTHKTKFPML